MQPTITTVVEPYPSHIDLTDNLPPEPLLPVRQPATRGDEIKLEHSPTPCPFLAPVFPAPPPVEDAWVILQSLTAAFAIGGVVGGMLCFAFSNRKSVE